MEPHSHCHVCGEQYSDTSSWPRQCDSCGRFAWRNPKPVAVALVPIGDDGILNEGIAIAHRVEKDKGKGWSLIGGFVDCEDDSFEAAARREFHEETGIMLEAGFHVIGSAISTNRDVMLTFCLYDDVLTKAEWAEARLCPENDDFGIFTRDADFELCFPTHQEYATKLLSGQFAHFDYVSL